MKDRSTESDAATALERALLDAARSDCIPAELKARMAAGLITPPPLTAASAVQSKAPLRLGELLFSKASLWGSLTLALIALGGASVYRQARNAAVASSNASAKQTAAPAPEPWPAVGADAAPKTTADSAAPKIEATGTQMLAATQPVAAGADRPRAAHERASARMRRTATIPTLAARAPAESQLRTDPGPEQPPASPVEETSGDSTELQSERPEAAARGPNTSALREELVLLDRARDALRSGSNAQALSLLDQHAARFARGALAPEADALAIETLLRSGARERAAQRAERFLQRHAGHPLAAQVERWRDAALR